MGMGQGYLADSQVDATLALARGCWLKPGHSLNHEVPPLLSLAGATLVRYRAVIWLPSHLHYEKECCWNGTAFNFLHWLHRFPGKLISKQGIEAIAACAPPPMVSPKGLIFSGTLPWKMEARQQLTGLASEERCKSGMFAHPYSHVTTYF